MTNKTNNKQNQSKNINKKYEKYEKTTSTPQAPLVTGHETVPLRIKTELMTVRECERLKRITARDTRIIRDYLRIIFHNEEKRVIDKGKLKRLVRKDLTVDISVLDKLTLTTSKNTEHKLRKTVSHDLKKRYPRCSHNEFQECSKKAIWTYESWRKQQERSKKELNRPRFNKKIPRNQLMDSEDAKRSFTLIPTPDNKVAKLWLKMKDSLDSKRFGKRSHERLLLPLAYSPYHEKKLKLEQIKMMELVYKSNKRQWYAHFIQKYSIPSYQSNNPPSVLGVDLGIKKTAVAVLLTPRGKVVMDEVRFIVNKERQAKIFRLNKKIQSIQRELDSRINTGQPHNQLNVKLSQLRRKRRSVTENELGYAVNQLMEYILQLKNKYNLFVSVGYPKDIRRSYPRGSGNKSHRRRLNEWYYRLFIMKLRYKLKQEGFDSYRVVAVNEDNTSKTCSRCNSTNATRIGQGKFSCHNCNYELNADLNGAKNIAKRLLEYVLKPKFGYIWDLLTKDTHNLELYDCFQHLSQWLKSP